MHEEKIYHPRDANGYKEPTQKLVNGVRKRVSFRKQFNLPNIWDCRDGYYIRITYVYTGINKKDVRSIPVTVKVK